MIIIKTNRREWNLIQYLLWRTGNGYSNLPEKFFCHGARWTFTEVIKLQKKIIKGENK